MKRKRQIPKIEYINIKEFNQDLIDNLTIDNFENKDAFKFEEKHFSFQMILSKLKNWKYIIKYKSIISPNDKYIYELSNTIENESIEKLKESFINWSFIKINERIKEKEEFYKK